ncbi:transcriptional regulatory protein LysR family [Scytonema sp. HK-05]|uniref:LysR family transcriptional regulator n=1 Tax=Scytonema sp. HK-05 TaxID=1137095 RepID=UPI0009360384|nr:LysR family transcriptional regulator [Scytonema sp. HK-05]OKH58716.1 hypothetical protein NIES2130_12590 [Scytonema sp. HK-05]BAY43379.1 transcriptional regulatory protein LysR family [Scytonema sp. HK-05]
MNLNQLKYFLVVAETGSFTKAAERLFITQPSLSVGIQKLEENLGVKLFERGKKYVLLTSAGKYFMEKAQDILNQFEAVKTELRYTHDTDNTLKLGILHTLPIVPLAKLISSFSKVYPDIIIEQLSGDMVELQNWLEIGAIDLAISVIKDKEDRKTAQILFQENYVVAIAKEHPLAKKKSLFFSELHGLPYIDQTRCEVRGDLQRLFVERFIYPKITYQVVDDEIANALVALGIGLAVVPTHSSMPGIVHLPFSDLNLIRQVVLACRSEQNLKTVNLFQEFSTLYFTEKSLASPKANAAKF